MSLDLIPIARRIAQELGDDFDLAFADKQDWSKQMGWTRAGPRAINMPYKCDYLNAAQAAADVIICDDGR